MFDAYDWSVHKLFGEFTECTLKLGLSGSGLAFDPSHGNNRIRFHVLRSAMLARLEGKVPPFKRGAKVKALANAYIECCLDPEINPYGRPGLVKDTEYTVHSMHYQCADAWHIALNELQVDGARCGYFLYDAKHLELVP